MLTYHQRYYLRNRERILSEANAKYAQIKSPKKERDIVKTRWKMSLNSMPKIGKDWNISLEDYRQLISEGCFYCGRELSTQTGSSLDRIDNSKDYTTENVLPCCGECNMGRGNRYTVDEWQIMVLSLLKYREA